jgi:hypothetical protein
MINALNDKERLSAAVVFIFATQLYVYDHCTAIWKVLTQQTRRITTSAATMKNQSGSTGYYPGRLGKPKTLIRTYETAPANRRMPSRSDYE